MATLLAIDPSVRSIGAAVFSAGDLIACHRITVPVLDGEEDGARWVRCAWLVAKWVSDLTIDTPTTVIFEKPQIYSWSKAKGDPNQLLGLAGVGAAVAMHYSARSAPSLFRILSPTPAEWCGQIPKATKGSAKESPRAKRILSRLKPGELALVPNQHDVLDAVGLGLHALGRLGIKHVYRSE